MDIFTQLLQENPEITRVQEWLGKEAAVCDVTGVSDAAKPQLIHGITMPPGRDESAGGQKAERTEETSGGRPASAGTDFDGQKPLKLVVCADEEKAAALYEACRFFDGDTFYYPAKDMLFYQSDVHGNAQTAERIRVLKALREGRAGCLVVCVDALQNRLVPPERFYDGIIRLENGQEVNRQELVAELVHRGYESVYACEHHGEFSVRGGILDVFPLTEEHPYRIEFWDDEIDSLRIFDEGTQKSIEKTDAVEIYPAMELVLTSQEVVEGIRRMEEDVMPLYETYQSAMRTEEAFRLKSGFEEKKESLSEGLSCQEAEGLLPYFCRETVSLLEYLGRKLLVFYDDIGRIFERAGRLAEEFEESCRHRLEAGLILPGQAGMLFGVEALSDWLAGYPGVVLSTLEAARTPLVIRSRYYLHVTAPGVYRGNVPLLIKDLMKYRKAGQRVLMVIDSRTRAGRLAADLMGEGINAFFTEDRNHEIKRGEVMLLAGALQSGLVYPDNGVIILCEHDVFGTKNRRQTSRRRKYSGDSANRVRDLSDLSPGDYVVHENHGLGIYQGIEKLTVDRVEKDYIKISYAKGANLYILASQFDMIGKYGSVGDKKPKLSTLGTGEWARTKARTRGAVAMVARELVELYADRQSRSGYAYGADTVWQKEFEETFPYEETAGQISAIEDVKKDMMSDKIMDRLICGDVGYGKTEIAIRAAFKAVQENKQVVYLCPTTILCSQHYHTFVTRMAGYPVNIAMLSRFCTPKEIKETLEGLRTGTVDIVIGTHRVLSKDVSYKDLGLLIIDEEQRFGVTHKEKIKQLRKTVDVMSLSATPIPRTLHMSLVGIRDMSLLDEAPMERMPIQTFVFEQNDEMVREAISRELSRGGQVYYVSNRIRGIDELAAHISELLPQANVAYAHGRMSKERLEAIMGDFINREIDVLVATTIIEIGLDISNVNTIIIHNADMLGLSQLYQLRGRVGRSNRRAYAFLMYKRDKLLREVAQKRLAAIREFTELGSGFKIAMRDLEIRGAGTMLGEAQSGHMEAVGYDLYCKMLSEAVKKEKGQTVGEDFETTVDLTLDAYIPPGYIADETQKLAMYRRIAAVQTEEEKEEMVEELVDRYGDPPKAVMNLLLVTQLRHLAHRVYVTEIKQNDKKIRLMLLPQAGLDPVAVMTLVGEYKPCAYFQADKEKPMLELDVSRSRDIRKKDIPAYVRGFLERLSQEALLNPENVV